MTIRSKTDMLYERMGKAIASIVSNANDDGDVVRVMQDVRAIFHVTETCQSFDVADFGANFLTIQYTDKDGQVKTFEME